MRQAHSYLFGYRDGVAAGIDLALALVEEDHGRTLAGVYKARTGRTPAKAIDIFRPEVARRLIEETDQRVQTVALRTGFGDEERMRTTFRRHLGVSPHEYRDSFGQGAPLRLES